MSDWLSALEAEKKRKESTERIEAERQKRQSEQGRAERKERERASYDNNRDKIEEIYSQLLTNVKRAEDLGFRFSEVKRYDHTLHLVWGPHKSFMLTPDGDGFDAMFFDLYDNRNVCLHRHIPFHRISEHTILDWVKWLAKGEGRPWRQRWQLFG